MNDTRKFVGEEHQQRRKNLLVKNTNKGGKAEHQQRRKNGF
jgi:hypothetical protein